MRNQEFSTDNLSAAGRCAFVFLWLFVCSIPAEKAVEVPGLGSISRLLGALALASGFLAILMDGRIRRPTRAHTVLALFVLWSAISLRWSLDRDATIVKVSTCVQLFGFAWLIWEFSPRQHQVTKLMQAYVFGTMYSSLDTLVKYQIARQTYYHRYAAEGFDPNDLALTLAIGIPVAYGLAIQARGPRAWIYWLQLGLVSMTILLSASRSGFMAACGAALIVPLTLVYTRRNQRMLLAAGLMVIAIALWAAVPATSWARLATIGSEVESGTLNQRAVIWSAGVSVFRQHWLAGVGSGAYPRSVEPILGWPFRWSVVAHNTFLSVLVETGLIGTILFATFLGTLAAAICRMKGASRMVWAVAFLAWFIGTNTLTWEVRKPTWLLFALVLTQARIAQTGTERKSRACAVPQPRAYATCEVVLP